MNPANLLPVLLLAACAARTPAGAPGGGAAAPRPPNILIVLADECAVSALGCYGGRFVETPALDRIAAEGLRCTRFYATTPLCSPSRAAFLTGRYPQHTGVTHNNLVLPARIATFATVLRARGYATGWAGKWHLAGTPRPGWAQKPTHGFDDVRYLFNRGHWKKLVEGAEGPRVGARGPRGRPTYALQGADEESYTTDFLTSRALRFLAAHAGEPFCFVLSLPDPHGPELVRPPYDRLLEGVPIPPPPNFAPGARTPPWAPPNPRLTPRRLARILRLYYGMVRCIDDNVARLIAFLEARGLLDRTILVFTSDHGDLCGEHHRLNKGNPYEGSARVPFLVRWPAAIPRGRSLSANLSSVDWFPTLLGLLGLEVPPDLDGRDLSAWFRDPDRPPPEPNRVFLRGPDRSPWLCTVEDDLKLVLDPRGGPWLFDLSTDPWERRNVASEARYQERLAALVEALRRYAARTGDPYAAAIRALHGR